MAKIVFFNDSRGESPAEKLFKRQLINHAAETAHEIYLVTDQDDQSYHSKVQILRAFKKWNLIETAKFFQILLQMDADIFHFFEPAHLGFGHAFPIIAAFAKSARVQSIMSLFRPTEKFSKRLQAFIESCTSISVIDPYEAALLKRRFKNIKVEVLPVQRFIPESYVESVGAWVPKKFIFLPENLNLYRDPARMIRVFASRLAADPELYLVCSGSLLDFDLKLRRSLLHQLHEVSGRVLWTGPLTHEMKLKYMEQAQIVILAGLIHSPLLIFEAISLILAAGQVSILEVRQVEVTQAKLVHKIHAHIIEFSQLDLSLSELLANSSLRESLRNNLALAEPSQNQDDLANHLSRAYVKLLEQDI